VTTLIQRMREELVRRNYAATTIHSYLKAVEHFQQHIDKPLDQLGPDDLRSYHAHLLGERKLAVNTVVLNICALRFLYIKVLKRRDMKEDLPYPKQRQRLPVILSPGEVAELIGAASNLYHRAMLMTLYSTGLRRAELCRRGSGRSTPRAGRSLLQSESLAQLPATERAARDHQLPDGSAGRPHRYLPRLRL
jgi:integrase/recombinase XerD